MSDPASESFGWREIGDGEAWDGMLAELNGHPLQSARWGEARREVDGHKSLYLMFEENGNPLCMARVETRRLPVVGKVAWIPRGPSRALNVGSCDVEIGLRQELRRYGFSLIISDEYTRCSDISGIRTIWIDLVQGLDALKKRIDKQWLYGTRKAARQGVEVVRTASADELSAFYQMCSEISMSKGFELPGSEALMQKLLQAPMTPDQEMQLFLAKYEGRIGAGAFVARSGRHAHYFWGASDRELSRLRVGEAVQWAVIEWAHEQGCSRYDLEGIDPVNNPGVYAFKKKMGGDEVTLQGMRSYPLNWRGTAIKAVGRLTRRI
ncbi:GNAT family N-acetyltransferase [Desulfosarcina sp.]|nr:GNAT family N-acetyltransferase [Desulfosarcina sp.]